MTVRPQIRFYTRTGCHLCEQAEALLARLTAQLGVVADITVIDLADNPQYEAAYGFRVPVIEAGGAVVEAPVTESNLRQLLVALRDDVRVRTQARHGLL